MPRRNEPIWRTCVQCGKAFKTFRRDAMTCGTVCRSRKSRGEEPTVKVRRKAIA